MLKLYVKVEAQPEQQAVEDVQKSLSKSSVKSAASKTSVRSKSGSKTSLNGEAGTVSVKDSPSKSSVASKTSVKSKSGSKASLNKEDVAKEVSEYQDILLTVVLCSYVLLISQSLNHCQLVLLNQTIIRCKRLQAHRLLNRRLVKHR